MNKSRHLSGQQHLDFGVALLQCGFATLERNIALLQCGFASLEMSIALLQ